MLSRSVFSVNSVVPKAEAYGAAGLLRSQGPCACGPFLHARAAGAVVSKAHS